MKNDQTQLVLDILSSKWATRIVKVLDDDTRRFSEIQKALPDTKQKVLTETLRKLERSGIIDRRAYPTIPPRSVASYSRPAPDKYLNNQNPRLILMTSLTMARY